MILQVLNQAGENFVSIKEVIGEDGKPDLLFSMDRSKLGNLKKKNYGLLSEQ